MGFKKKERAPLFSVIIVSYNAVVYIADCLDSVEKQTFEDFEVIVVDNGSDDNTPAAVRRYGDVNLIVNGSNKGFCAANNQGIKASKGEYVVTLNSDAVLDRDFLKELEKAAQDKNYGMLAAKILNKNGSAIDSTGLELSSFYRFFDRGSGEKDSGQYDNRRDVFGPCAAAALYKREMLEDIYCAGEYFDEDFFFLAEDFDIAWRARRKNWRALYVPGAVCYHARNSTDFNRDFRQYLSFRNRVFLLLKNARPGLFYLSVFLVYDMPRFFYMLFINKFLFRSLKDIVKCLPVMINKRKALVSAEKS